MSLREQLGVISTNLLSAAEQFSSELSKAEARAPSPGVPQVDDAELEARALLWDPFSIVEQLGYKDRPSAITYGTLQQIIQKVPLIQAIIVTRLNQVAQFARPRRDMFKPGFRVTPCDEDATLSPADKKFAQGLEQMFMTTGVTDYAQSRDGFPTFLRKVIRDSLTYDQLCYEVVPNRKGLPAKIQAVDASTIRLANSVNVTYTEDPDTISAVQIYDNVIINEWRCPEMAFGVRNPHTNIRLHGYGYSETEMLINAVTSWLWGFDYNSKFFNQGTVAKGLLNIQGTMNKVQLKAFRRQWYQQVSGVENAWRSPVLNSDGKVEWIDMGKTNRDMEFSQWMDFLIKLISGIFQIDPMELGFKYGNQGQDKSMFESGTSAKLTASKDKGLKPLLDFAGDDLTKMVVAPIDKDWKLEFVGLDQHTKDDLAKLNRERSQATHTVNELREEMGLESLGEHGDIILNPVYVQNVNQQQAMAAGMAGDGQDPDEPPDFSEDDFASLAGGGDEDDDEAKKSLVVQNGSRKTIQIELEV